MYHQRQGYNEPDVLRARFTVWIEKLIKNAKIDYIRQLNKTEPEFVSIDELFEDEQLIGARDVVISEDKDSFDFQEERLAEACMTPESMPGSIMPAAMKAVAMA